MQKWIVVLISMTLSGILACGSSGDVQQREFTVELNTDHGVDIPSRLPPGDPHDLEAFGDDHFGNDDDSRTDTDGPESDDPEEETMDDDDDVVIESLGFHTNDLESGVANVAYHQEIATFGGSGECRWTVTGLPAGLELHSDHCEATVEGTPMTGGTFAVHFEACDSATDQCASADSSLTISYNLVIRSYLGTHLSGGLSRVTRALTDIQNETVEIPSGQFFIVVAEAFGDAGNGTWTVSPGGVRKIEGIPLVGLPSLPEGRSRWVIKLVPTSPSHEEDHTYRDVRITFSQGGELAEVRLDTLKYLANPCASFEVSRVSVDPRPTGDLYHEKQPYTFIYEVEGGLGPFQLRDVDVELLSTPYRDVEVSILGSTTTSVPNTFDTEHNQFRLGRTSNHSVRAMNGRLIPVTDFYEEKMKFTVFDEGCALEAHEEFLLKLETPWVEFEQLYQWCEGRNDLPPEEAYPDISILPMLCACPENQEDSQCVEMMELCTNPPSNDPEHYSDRGFDVASCQFVLDGWRLSEARGYEHIDGCFRNCVDE